MEMYDVRNRFNVLFRPFSDKSKRQNRHFVSCHVQCICCNIRYIPTLMFRKVLTRVHSVLAFVCHYVFIMYRSLNLNSVHSVPESVVFWCNLYSVHESIFHVFLFCTRVWIVYSINSYRCRSPHFGVEFILYQIPYFGVSQFCTGSPYLICFYSVPGSEVHIRLICAVPESVFSVMFIPYLSIVSVLILCWRP